MRFKQQGALHLFVLLAVLATMIGIAFTIIFFLDQATLNRAQFDHKLSAREANPPVRPMTVDTTSQRKPLNINDALEMLNQPVLEDINKSESSGLEASRSPLVDLEEISPEDSGSESVKPTTTTTGAEQ